MIGRLRGMLYTYHMMYLQLVGFVWVAIWLHLYLGGPRHRILPINRPLQIWSTVTLVSIFLFYTTFYLPYNIPVSEGFLIEQELRILLAIASIAIGFILIIVSRQALAHLSGAEVFVSLSQSKSSHWIYMHLAHPMYYGIGMVLLGSWLLLPNLYSIPFALTAYIAMRQKSHIESQLSKN